MKSQLNDLAETSGHNTPGTGSAMGHSPSGNNTGSC